MGVARVYTWTGVLLALLFQLSSTPNALASQGCDPIIVQTKLPSSCILNDPSSKERQDSSGTEEELQTSFARAVCSMAQCMSGEGACAREDAMCCCRSKSVEEFEISCTDKNAALDPRLKTNATSCGCAPCDDVMISVRVRVKGQGDDGPIPAAQIFDVESEELIGLTLYNGALDFEVAYRKRKLQLLIQATGYQRVTRGILLSPERKMVIQNITMARTMVANIGHGKSEIVYPLGKWAWLYAQPGTFHKNGTTHDRDVIFKGSYVDASSAEVLDMIESDKFEVDGKQFAMIAALFMEFEDSDGEPLDVKDLRLAVPVDEEEEIVDMFAVVHDWESGRWSKVSTFSPVQTKRDKRATISNVICEAPDISVAEFIVLATDIDVDCWAQVRTFDNAQDPFPGPLVSIVQRRVIGGLDVLFRFGTDTGGVQSSSESLASNAVCIPLECNDFMEVTLSARVDPNSLLIPVPFPADTFMNDPTEPTIVDSTFVLTAFRPAEIASTPHPIYVFVDNCIQQAQETNALSNPRDYFSFSTNYEPLEPDTDQCYIKLSTSNCFFRTDTSTVVTFDPQTGAVTSSQSFLREGSLAVPSLGSGFPEECLEYETSCPSMCTWPGSTCVPFRCGDVVHVSVTSTVVTTGDVTTCQLTGVSPVLADSVLAFRGTTFQPILELDTSVLDPDSYNDPELGLYYDPQPTRARELCNGGGRARGFITRVGNAADFGCFTDSGP